MTKNTLTVSIIIPNYNHESFLPQRISSVLNQTYQEFELILLDDCSTDNSREIIESHRSHPKVSHVILNESNSGSPFKQWLKGIDLAKGEYIWLAESDDFADELFLKKVMARFATDAKLDVVFAGTTNVNEKNEDFGNTTRIERKKAKLLAVDFKKPGSMFLMDFLPNYCIIRNASSAVFKKSVVTPLAKKVVTYKTIGDLYFWIVLCLQNRSFAYIAEKLNFMRNHQSNVRQSDEKKQFKAEEYQRIYKLILAKSWYRPSVVKVIGKERLKFMLNKK